MSKNKTIFLDIQLLEKSEMFFCNLGKIILLVVLHLNTDELQTFYANTSTDNGSWKEFFWEKGIYGTWFICTVYW